MVKKIRISSFISGTNSIQKIQSLLLIIVTTAGALLSVLPLDTARTAATEGRFEAEIDVFLAVQTNDE